MCPGNEESAGTSRSGRTRTGSPWLRAVLEEPGRSAGRTQTYLGAQFRRIAARRGSRRAPLTVGHSILVAASWILVRDQPVTDLGVNYFDQRDREHVRHITRRLEALGFTVTLQPAGA